MKRSEAINDLAGALAKAQKAMEGAKKDSENPFFRSRYADLASVRDACNAALTANGLSVLQSPQIESVGDGEIITRTTKGGEERDVVRVLTKVTVTTLLMHESGQWIEDDLSCILPTSDPQAIGSGITYLRRYALSAFTGVAPEDDDGEAAMARGTASKAAVPNGALEVSTFKVLGVAHKPIPGGKTRHTVHGDDRRVYQTLDKKHADIAEDAKAAGVPVTVTWKDKGYGPDIVTLTEAVEAPV